MWLWNQALKQLFLELELAPEQLDVPDSLSVATPIEPKGDLEVVAEESRLFREPNMLIEGHTGHVPSTIGSYVVE